MEIDNNYCLELEDLSHRCYMDNDVKLAMVLKCRIMGAIRAAFSCDHDREVLTMLGRLFKLEANISIFILAALNVESMNLQTGALDIVTWD